MTPKKWLSMTWELVKQTYQKTILKSKWKEILVYSQGLSQKYEKNIKNIQEAPIE